MLEASSALSGTAIVALFLSPLHQFLDLRPHYAANALELGDESLIRSQSAKIRSSVWNLIMGLQGMIALGTCENLI